MFIYIYTFAVSLYAYSLTHSSPLPCPPRSIKASGIASSGANSAPT